MHQPSNPPSNQLSNQLSSLLSKQLTNQLQKQKNISEITEHLTKLTTHPTLHKSHLILQIKDLTLFSRLGPSRSDSGARLGMGDRLNQLVADHLGGAIRPAGHGGQDEFIRVASHLGLDFVAHRVEVGLAAQFASV